MIILELVPKQKLQTPIPKLQFLWNLGIGHSKLKEGFTLIELLVVMGILSLTIGSILLFLTASLKGSNQANVTSEVKQNGQAILDSLERQIRNASDATQTSTGIALTFKEGNDLYIACFPPVPATSNGWIGTASVTHGSLPSSYIAITNQDPVSGVDVSTGCSFTVTELNTGTENPDIVAVSFTINQGINAPSRKDFQANVKFQTTISLRGY